MNLIRRRKIVYPFGWDSFHFHAQENINNPIGLPNLDGLTLQNTEFLPKL